MREAVRLGAVLPPVIPIIGELVRQVPGTISLAQGVVGYPPPVEALKALTSITGDVAEHQYAPDEGLPELLDALRRKLASENGIRAGSGSRIVVTAGSNMAFCHAVSAIADPGDEIILPAPYYFNHHMAVTLAGCKPVTVPTDARYQLDPERVERAITARTRAVVTVSPNNPTGAVYPEVTLRAVNELCERHGVYHVHDEAYEYFVYGATPHFSPASASGADGHTISLFSFSKTYALAAWRVGYMVIPAGLLDAVDKIQDTVIICAPVPSQRAALAALRAGPAYWQEQVAKLARVRDTVVSRLGDLADICGVPRPEGAFYCFLRLRASFDSLRLVERLVREHRVAAVPGSAFGETGACCLRVSYGALDAGTVGEGIRRLVTGLRAIAA